MVYGSPPASGNTQRNYVSVAGYRVPLPPGTCMPWKKRRRTEHSVRGKTPPVCGNRSRIATVSAAVTRPHLTRRLSIRGVGPPRIRDNYFFFFAAAFFFATGFFAAAFFTGFFAAAFFFATAMIFLLFFHSTHTT